MASSPITSWEIDEETVSDLIFGGSKITADGDCSHDIKRCLLLGRKFMTNLESILKSRDVTLSTKVHLGKAMFFPVQFSSVQLLSCVWLFATPWIAAHQASLSITHSQSLPCPSSQWCHPAVSSSVVPFSSCPQSLPASESFPMSQLFAWGGQSIGDSASTSVLPMDTRD